MFIYYLNGTESIQQVCTYLYYILHKLQEQLKKKLQHLKIIALKYEKWSKLEHFNVNRQEEMTKLIYQVLHSTWVKHTCLFGDLTPLQHRALAVPAYCIYSPCFTSYLLVLCQKHNPLICTLYRYKNIVAVVHRQITEMLTVNQK